MATLAAASRCAGHVDVGCNLDIVLDGRRVSTKTWALCHPPHKSRSVDRCIRSVSAAVTDLIGSGHVSSLQASVTDGPRRFVVEGRGRMDRRLVAVFCDQDDSALRKRCKGRGGEACHLPFAPRARRIKKMSGGMREAVVAPVESRRSVFHVASAEGKASRRRCCDFGHGAPAATPHWRRVIRPAPVARFLTTPFLPEGESGWRRGWPCFRTISLGEWRGGRCLGCCALSEVPVEVLPQLAGRRNSSDARCHGSSSGGQSDAVKVERGGGGGELGGGGGGRSAGGAGTPVRYRSLSEMRRPAIVSRSRSEFRASVDSDDNEGVRSKGFGSGDGYGGRDRSGKEKQGTWEGSRTTQQEKAMVKSRRKRKSLPKPVRPSGPVCYGCGAKLQTVDADVPGYVDEAKYELKKLHHQLKDVMCGRCHALSQGQMVAAVGGHGGYGNGKGFVLAEDLRRQLLGLQHQRVLVIKLVDIIDFNGSFLGRVRDLVGANPIILVVTKVDLLPEGTDVAAVADWLLAATLRKKLNVISIHLTSAKNGAGIGGVAANIMRERQGRDVYVLGAANVGKSAFISALLDEMAKRDVMAANARRFRPVQSAMPGTTLGPIPINAFSSGGDLYDTPGVHLHHRMPAVVDPKDLPLLAPRRRVRPYVVSAPSGSNAPNQSMRHISHAHDLNWGMLSSDTASVQSRSSTTGAVDDGDFGWSEWGRKAKAAEYTNSVMAAGESKRGLAGCSLFWGGLVRIDILQAPPSVQLAFYGSTAVHVHVVQTSQADDFYERELGQKLSPPPSRQEGREWRGLQKTPVLQFMAEVGPRSSIKLAQARSLDLCPRPAGEVAISGLGWFSINCIQEGGNVENQDGDSALGLPQATAHNSTEPEECLRGGGDGSNTTQILLALHVPKGVEVFLRSPLPVGKSASSWYEWLDLGYFEESEDRAKQLPALFYPNPRQ